MNGFPIDICIPNPSFEHGLKVLCIYLLVVSVFESITYSETYLCIAYMSTCNVCTYCAETCVRFIYLLLN